MGLAIMSLSIVLGPIDIEPNDAVPIALDTLKREPIDIEPINAVPIALDPLEQKPTEI